MSLEGGIIKKRYCLRRKNDGICLKVERHPNASLLVSVEDIINELTKRNISYDFDTIKNCFEEASGEEILISSWTPVIDTSWKIEVIIEENRMKAVLKFFPSLTEGILTSKDIEEVVSKYCINKGIKQHVFSEVLQNSRYCNEWIIAEGVYPRPGKDAELIYCFSQEEGKSKPLELEDGSVDFYNYRSISQVKAGDILVVRKPASLGTSGYDVYGNTLPAKSGKDVRLPMGKNCHIIDNNLKLAASKDGRVVIIEGKVNVLPIYEIKGDVDFSTGNIQFNGTVIIMGSIKNGFTVKANGDVDIWNNLEGKVEAGGNLQVRKGIVRGQAEVKGNVCAHYIENSVVKCDGIASISEAIMHSSVDAGKKIMLQGKKGIIVGGRCSAGEEIVAQTIGSPVGTQTLLEVGIRPELRQEYKDSSRKLIIMQQEYQKNQKILKSLTKYKELKGILPPDKNELFLKFCRVQYHAHKEIEDLKRRVIELEACFAVMAQALIIARKRLFSGVEVYMGNSNTSFTDELKSVRLILKGCDIVVEPL